MIPAASYDRPGLFKGTFIINAKNMMKMLHELVLMDYRSGKGEGLGWFQNDIPIYSPYCCIFMETCVMQDLSYNFRALLMNLAAGLGDVDFFVLTGHNWSVCWASLSTVFSYFFRFFHLHWYRVCHDIVVFFRDTISSFNLAVEVQHENANSICVSNFCGETGDDSAAGLKSSSFNSDISASFLLLVRIGPTNFWLMPLRYHSNSNSNHKNEVLEGRAIGDNPRKEEIRVV